MNENINFRLKHRCALRDLAYRQVCFAGCRLQVAGCGLKFNYNWKTAGTLEELTSGRLTVTVT